MNYFTRLFRKLPACGFLFFATVVSQIESTQAAQSARVVWDATPDADVSGYNIYYGTASGSYANKVTVGNVTTATVTGLTDGVTYYFAATAYNDAALESDPSNEISYSVSSASQNQIPTLDSPSNISLNPNPGIQTINLSGISSGAVGENQFLTVSASSSNPALVSAVTVTYTSPATTGLLIFAPIANAFGSTIISVTVNDGQPQNNTITRSFVVTVNAPNQPPTLDVINNLVINQNASVQNVNLTGISSGAANENQVLTITATSSNAALIAKPVIAYTSPNSTATLSFTPVANATGSTTITVTVDDGQPLNHLIVKTFTVAVNPVSPGNLPPTLNPPGNLTINQNASVQNVNLTGISSGAANENQVLTITATSSNAALIAKPVIAYTSPNSTATLSFTPVANATGSTTITVTVDDGQPLNHLIVKTFTVAVNPVSPGNLPPTLNPPGNLTINQNTSQQSMIINGISTGSSTEVQTLTITASSSNPGLIPNPNIFYSSPNALGVLSFIPVANAFGTATITITVNDGQAQNNLITRSFLVTVIQINQPPTLNPFNNLVLNQNAGQQTVALNGISSGSTFENQTLALSVSSSNPGLVPTPVISYSSPTATGTLTFLPAANQSGSSTITVTVNDGQPQNNSVTRSFVVTVNSANQPPTISSLADQISLKDQIVGPILFTISDAETASDGLSLSASASNPDLVSDGNISFTGSGGNRFVTVKPTTQKTGQSDITIFVSDGVSTASTVFHLDVNAQGVIGTSGSGTVSPNLDLQSLVAGNTYTITASPQAGNEFAGWSGGTNSTNPSLTFVYRSDLTLTANFIPSGQPLVLAKGVYQGLFYENEEIKSSSAGFFNISLTDKGAYSGQLRRGIDRYSFSGIFDKEGNATSTISRPAPLHSLIITLRLGRGENSDRVSGNVNNGSWISSMLGNRAVFNIKSNPASLAGRYTARIPGQNTDSQSPGGDGFFTMMLNKSGAASVVGTLADGTAFSASANLSKDGHWPLYVPLYTGKGSIISWLNFTNQSQMDMLGLLNWIKPADVKAKCYPGGFTNECEVTGSTYFVNPGRPLLDIYLAAVTFQDGNVNPTNLFILRPNNQVVVKTPTSFRLKFAPANGVFSGTTLDPVTRKSYPFKGVVLQKANTGSGFLLGGNQSSPVEIIE
ncbi:MAG: fibronectin type III domain-containing protein [Verrucomicrobiota bacterium]